MDDARVFLGLGSNLGDRAAELARAQARLQAGGFAVVARSRTYQTEPVGGPAQGWYLNLVLEGRTRLAPEELLQLALQVEEEAGRVRTEKDGPRTLDVDLLLYGALVLDTPALTLPHPRLHERRFVLEPLCELAPELSHPRLGKTVRQLLAECGDGSAVLSLPAAAPAS